MAKGIRIETGYGHFTADFGIISNPVTLTPFSVRFDVQLAGDHGAVRSTSHFMGHRGALVTLVTLDAVEGKLLYSVPERDAWSFVDAKASRQHLIIAGEGYPSARMRVAIEDGQLAFQINTKIKVTSRRDHTVDVKIMKPAGIATQLARDLASIVRPRAQIEQLEFRNPRVRV